MPTRFAALLCLVAASVLAAGCSRKESKPAATPATKEKALTPVVVQLDWVAEPEHGGLYQALERGFFSEAGLAVTLLPGGPNALATQKAATGQVQIAQADSTNTLLAIAEGLPVVQFMAVFQNDPSVLMLHEENPVRRFEELNGRTVMARPEWAFLAYLRNKYKIDFSIVPQNYSVAAFLADPDFIQQGFSIAEPFHIVKAGGREPRFLTTWDAGWDAYVVLIANAPWARAHPQALAAFTRAAVAGWQDYLNGDPTPANVGMKRANSNNTDEFLAYSRQKIIEGKLVTGLSGKDETGRLSPERVATQIRQLRELNILKKELRVDEVMRD
ncbi:ABC transporter substrate-binding protein [Nibricoccus sp. IMCC34717]|uniref:ABC transporter substrate-binding protein n=1 Tax=Nibricoccus sp. IMCC34717 TaxID=3034021 RepID=UPI0038501092